MNDYISFIPAIFELAGIYVISNKNRLGFIFNIVSNILWIAYSLITHSTYGLLLICSIALIINIKGFKKWT
jgi:hypothetical protein